MNKYLTPPPLINTPIAEDGDYNIIPNNIDEKGKASFSKGFPIETSIPFNQGGYAPRRLDMNGFLNLLSKHLYWYQSGGLAPYSRDLDYIPNNVVYYNDNIWVCIANNGPQNGGIIAPGANTNYWKTLPDKYGLAYNSSINAATVNLVREVTASGNTIRVTKQNGSVSNYTIQTGNWTLAMGETGWARENITGFTIQWGRSPKVGTQRVYFPRTFRWAGIVVATEISDRTRSFAVNAIDNSGFNWWPGKGDYCYYIATGIS